MISESIVPNCGVFESWDMSADTPRLEIFNSKKEMWTHADAEIGEDQICHVV